MTKSEKELLFQRAYERLKVAMHIADAMKGSPAAESGMPNRLMNAVAEAHAATANYRDAMARPTGPG